MPSRARAVALSRVISMAPNPIVPAIGGRIPMIVLISVVLPTPLRPITAMISARFRSQRHIVDNSDLTVAGRQGRDVKFHRRSSYDAKIYPPHIGIGRDLGE